MLETIQAMSLLTIIEIVGPIILAGALVFVLVRARRRHTGAADQVRESETRRQYDAEERRQQAL
jgi:hypothetical protein